MKLAIDLRCCQTQSATRGIGRYSYYLAESIAQINPGVEYICDPDRITRFPRAGSVQKIISESQLGSHSFYHQSSNFEWELPFLDPSRLLAKVKSVTIYDLIPLLFPEGYLVGVDEFAKDYYRRVDNLKKFDLLFAISESARNDVIKHLGVSEERVVNIYGSCDDFFRTPLLKSINQSDVFSRFGISSPYFVYTTANDHRKNNYKAIEGFAKACEKIGHGHQLVLVSSHFDQVLKEQLCSFAAQCGMKDGQLVVLASVSDDELKLLYTEAFCTYFPSLYEGFGLPILEAMCCASPVISSFTSSMPEIVGNAEQLFDPSDVASIADVVCRVVTNPEWRDSIAARGLARSSIFSWRSSAEKVIAAYSDI